VNRRSLLVGIASTVVVGAAAPDVAVDVVRDISAKRSKLLSTVQTSHETDRIIGSLVAKDTPCIGSLVKWMRRGSPVQRVNSAGSLAKVGAPAIDNDVISALKRDEESRLLYLRAAVSRVLAVPWDDAGRIVTARALAVMENDLEAREAIRRAETAVALLDAESLNPSARPNDRSRRGRDRTVVLSIAAAREQDVPAIADLLEEMDRFYGVTEFEPIEQRVAQVKDMIFSNSPVAYVLLATEDGNVVGLASYSFLWPAVGLTRSLFLKGLYIRELHRREGVGRQLMRRLFEVAVETGCSRVEWMTEHANANAQKFYKPGLWCKHREDLLPGRYPGLTY